MRKVENKIKIHHKGPTLMNIWGHKVDSRGLIYRLHYIGWGTVKGREYMGKERGSKYQNTLHENCKN